MTTSTRQTAIEIDEKVPLVRLVREFDAPPEKVFRAHTDPDLFAQWCGPRSLTTHIGHYDCRTGGAYRYTHTRGDEEYRFYGSFHEVRPNEVIVQTFCFEGMPDGVALERLEFEDLGDGRTKVSTRSVFDAREDRDGMLASGMEIGMGESYEKLDELLAA